MTYLERVPDSDEFSDNVEKSAEYLRTHDGLGFRYADTESAMVELMVGRIVEDVHFDLERNVLTIQFGLGADGKGMAVALGLAHPQPHVEEATSYLPTPSARPTSPSERHLK